MTELFKGPIPHKPCYQCLQHTVREGKHWCKLNSELTETARLKDDNCWQGNKRSVETIHSRKA